MSEDPFVRQAAVLRLTDAMIGVVNSLEVDVVGANAAAVSAEGFRDEAAAFVDTFTAPTKSVLDTIMGGDVTGLAKGEPLNTAKASVTTLAGFKTLLGESAVKGLHVAPGVIYTGTGGASNQPLITLPAGARWLLSGNGAVIKHADQAVTQNWTSHLRVRTSGGDVDRVDVRDIGFDGNARGQNLPAGAYDWQQSTGFKFEGLSSARILNVSVRNVDFKDPLADCISTNFYVDTLTVDNMRVSGRTQTRSDIQLSSLPRVTQISNFNGAKIEAETTAIPADVTHDFLVQIDQSVCSERLDIGLPFAASDRATFAIDNSWMGDAHFQSVKATVANSTIHFPVRTTPRRIYYPRRLSFNNCDFYLHGAADGTVEPLSFITQTAPWATSVEFRNCRFHLVPHPDFVGDYTGAAIETTTSGATAATPDRHDSYLFENCWFDPRFEINFKLASAYSVKLINNIYGSRGVAIAYTGHATFTSKVEIDGGDFGACGAFLRYDPSANTSLAIKNVVMDDTVGVISGAAPTGFFNSTTTRSTRILHVDNGPPVYGIKGEVARLKAPVPGAVCEWICTKNSYTASIWKPLSSVGS